MNQENENRVVDHLSRISHPSKGIWVMQSNRAAYIDVVEVYLPTPLCQLCGS